jgi:hypothetical protein
MSSKTSASALPAAFLRELMCCAGLGLGSLVGLGCRSPLAACSDDAREDDEPDEDQVAGVDKPGQHATLSHRQKGLRVCALIEVSHRAFHEDKHTEPGGDSSPGCLPEDLAS